MSEAKRATLLESYQRLLEISRDLAAVLDLDTLLNRIVNAAADLCYAEAASILLYDHPNQQLYFQAASNLDTPLMRGLIVPVEGSIAGWIITEKKPVIISDTHKDPRHFERIGKATKVTTNSLLGVPMITKEKTIGVLEAINKIEGVFNQDDLDLLAALGAQAAVAIENSRLFQQSDLISELIHELRTPLASLNAASYLILRPEMEEEKRVRIVQTMHREIGRLSEMASSFLDLARLESGRTQFSMEQINIPAILEESASVIRPRTEEKSQHLNVEVQSDIPPLIGDRDKIKQVIINLLSNAQKYTPEDGNIRLQASANNGEVIIRVIDDGPGIDADNLPYLFEKFYRVPGAESVAPGTGLGLSICKRIVETHRGYIDVESMPGKGTTFLVTLPLPEKT